MKEIGKISLLKELENKQKENLNFHQVVRKESKV